MNDLMLQTLAGGLPGLGLTLPEPVQEKLCAFARAMVKQNEVMNLTGITEDAPVAKLHLLDSLTVASCVDLKNKTLIDVGCGAGFPSLPLAIARPDLAITAIDSTDKRIVYVRECARRLGLQNLIAKTARAEDAAATDMRGKYDYATARAVA